MCETYLACHLDYVVLFSFVTSSGALEVAPAVHKLGSCMHPLSPDYISVVRLPPRRGIAFCYRVYFRFTTICLALLLLANAA